jgi:hypothetical protein
VHPRKYGRGNSGEANKLSDPDADKYNLNEYDKYLKNIEVDSRTVGCKLVKNVDSGFETTDEIRAMLKQKYRHGSVSQKSEEDRKDGDWTGEHNQQNIQSNIKLMCGI